MTIIKEAVFYLKINGLNCLNVNLYIDLNNNSENINDKLYNNYISERNHSSFKKDFKF